MHNKSLSLVQWAITNFARTSQRRKTIISGECNVCNVCNVCKAWVYVCMYAMYLGMYVVMYVCVGTASILSPLSHAWVPRLVPPWSLSGSTNAFTQIVPKVCCFEFYTYLPESSTNSFCPTLHRRLVVSSVTHPYSSLASISFYLQLYNCSYCDACM